MHQVLLPEKLTQASYKFLMPEAVCCCLQTCKCGFDIRVILCASVPSLTLTQRSYRHKQVLLPEAICCCLQTCNCGFAMT